MLLGYTRVGSYFQFASTSSNGFHSTVGGLDLWFTHWLNVQRWEVFAQTCEWDGNLCFTHTMDWDSLNINIAL